MSILHKAHDLIHGERARQYGPPNENLGAVAGMWEIYLHKRGLLNINSSGVMPEDVAVMMALLKIARLANDLTHEDSIVDAAGYIGLIERCGEHYVGDPE